MPRRSIPPASPSSDPRPKWRKKKRKRDTGKQQDSDSDSDSGGAASPSAAAGVGGGGGVGGADPLLDLRESEVVSGGAQKICDFPVAYKRTINRPHHSVLSIVAAERRCLTSGVGAGSGGNAVFLENVSHGQLQSVSAVASENLVDGDNPPVYVCTPPQLMEGKGVVRKFEGNRVLVVPAHSEWFSPTTVHRLERQVVPHFFSGKSPSHTPEKYVSLRNKIISKYLDNPTRRLAFGECQALVSSNTELYDLSRIVRFLDNWGIINYLALGSVHRGLRMAASLLKEDPGTGELQLVTAPLKSIDSLILFDRPKCSLKTEELAMLSTSSASSSRLLDLDNGLADLDGKIREKLSGNSCSYCQVPLPGLHYRSQKEADIALCLNCFHESKYIAGHSTIDFIRTDSKREPLDSESDSWTDQETLLLLEAIEKYNDRWNEIAEHVGTKSKAQCIQHFIRLPVEVGFLENIDVPGIAQSERMEREAPSSSYVPNGETSGVSQHDAQEASKFPFADAPNPVMSLVAFLASSIGPRVAAACANAALCVLTKEDSRSNSDGTHTEAGNHGPHPNMHNSTDRSTDDSLNPLSPEGVKYAASCGLSAAAVKAKLFADQEEREIQRLSATVINHQLKRLELKLKQFAEIETLLLKECEQVDKLRQRISAERVRMMTSGRIGPPLTGPIPAPMSAPTGTSSLSPNPRPPPPMSASMSAPNSTNPMNHAHLQQLMHRQQQMQQQMLSFGPRLPLSAIHPNLSSGPEQNVVFNSGTAGGVTPNHPNHPLNPMLRPSGNNSNVG
ncbi:SWI/SNF complex subunit SWI3C [Rhynchospora pubera]|uniref:SWI/SNF complex subunit SWI3C n=1 Tax=Rhynchospora pubera TaxID=906938 RepID=A0AAV8DIF7_9POAL|nr:SWI/SNF complex subunit SWI3C [Rhynchospora pubera]